MPRRKIRTSFRPKTPPLLTKSSTPPLPETPPSNIPLSSPIKASITPKTRLKKAIRYVRRYPDEPKAHIARYYKIPRKTLTNALKRVNEEPRQHGGQNKGLTIAQERVIDGFIRLQLEYNMLPLRAVIKTVIDNIRARDGQVPLSDRWFGNWWTSRALHKIRTKPIAVIRITAQDEKEVDEWFEKPGGYLDTLARFQIKDGNIYNFDETNARLGCPKGVDVIVPLEVTELFSLSPETRKSVTMGVTIGVMNKKRIPLVIIVLSS